jgi:hypothetical protein
MDFDSIIAGRDNGADRTRALAALHDLLMACAAERDRLKNTPGMFTRKTKRQRAAFADYEHAREWVTATFERIKVLEGWGGGYARSTSA